MTPACPSHQDCAEAGFMANTKATVERRKRRRFRIQNDTFVVLRSNGTKVGALKEITMEGLSFHYVGREEPLAESAELSIFSPDNDFYLFTVPCKITSDLKLYKKHPNSITMRRCGVKFGKLTDQQASEIEYFIQNHTTGEA
jgi:hypothetical protein